MPYLNVVLDSLNFDGNNLFTQSITANSVGNDGLTTLTVLQDTVHMIEKNRGVKVDIDNLTLDDAETYKLFARGDTTAIFQFESHGMRDILAPLPAHAD